MDKIEKTTQSHIMKIKHYGTPSLEVFDILQEGILCASVDDDIDFSSLGSEGIEDSGHTINWGK